MHVQVMAKFVAAVTVILVALTSTTACAEQPRVRIPGTYSSLQFNDEGGDLLGMEIKIVPIGDRFQAVILVSEGEAQPMVVVEVRVHGNSVNCDVPGKAGTSWKFSGRLTQKSLSGTVTHALGGVETVVLPRRCGYWDR